jgi:hypothetical protein
MNEVPIAGCKSELKLDCDYPLVINTPGFRGLSFENSLLCEILAKAENVVAVIPFVGIDKGVDSVSLEYQVQLIIDTKKRKVMKSARQIMREAFKPLQSQLMQRSTALLLD